MSDEPSEFVQFMTFVAGHTVVLLAAQGVEPDIAIRAVIGGLEAGIAEFRAPETPEDGRSPSGE